MYNQKIMNIFKNPQNVGSLRGANAIGYATDFECGDIVKIFLSIEDNIIKQAKFQAFGGAGIIAASSVATKLLKDISIDEALEFDISSVVAELGNFPENKKYCLRESISCRSEFEDFTVVFIVCTLLSIIFYYHWKPLPSFPIAEYCYDVPRIKNNTKVFHVGKDACNTMNQTSFEIQYFFGLISIQVESNSFK